MTQLVNVLIIIGIIVLCIIAAWIYSVKFAKEVDEFDTESASGIDYLIKGVKEYFNDIQKENLQEQNLSAAEYKKEQRKRNTIRKNLKDCGYGDKKAQEYIRNYIVAVIQDKYQIDNNSINKIIPFNKADALSDRDMSDIIFYIYFKQYKEDGFEHWVNDYHLADAKNITERDEENGAVMYQITSQDLLNSFRDIYSKYELTFEDKLEIVARRILSQYKSCGCIDWLREFAIDEIDAGVSGIPSGAFDLKFEHKLKNPIFSYESVYVVYKGLNLKLRFLGFKDQKDLIRVSRNIYKYKAPYALSRLKGYVIGTTKDGSRIAVARPPIVNGWAFFLRKFDSAPSVAPEKLLKNDLASTIFIPITIIKWIVRSCISMIITGGMGTGKTTWIKSATRFIPSQENIGVYELSPELNMEFTYPERNIVPFSVSENTPMEEVYDFGKKTNRTITIIGEIATAIMGVLGIHAAQVGTKCMYGTHHAKSAEALVHSLRDNLITKGGYSSEKIAEETVVNVLPFDMHLRREKQHRYIERITEIIPIRDRRYPSDKGSAFGNEDTLEYYKRSTDRQNFETRDIVGYDKKLGGYVMLNPISPEMIETMASNLSDEDEAKMREDMRILNSLIRKE